MKADADILIYFSLDRVLAMIDHLACEGLVGLVSSKK